MQEILRHLYNRKYNEQRLRIQKTLEEEPHFTSKRRMYNFRDQIPLHTPRTSITLDEEIRFDKEIQDLPFQPYQPSTNPKTTKQQTLKLPTITKVHFQVQIKPKSYIHKFRTVAKAIFFICILRNKYKNVLKQNKKQSELVSKKLLKTIKNLVQNYYEKILQQEIERYMNLIEVNTLAMEKKQSLAYNAKEAIEVLFFISKKLSESSITKQTLQFFIAVARNNAFFPADYLSHLEINRLQFSAEFGCSIDVGAQQSKMIVGLGLGVKIFCLYVLYRPWLLSKSIVGLQVLYSKYPQVASFINDFSSVFYFILMEEFCWLVKEINSVKRQFLDKFGIKPVSIFQIGLKKTKQNEIASGKHLIANQKRNFLTKMQVEFPQLTRDIRNNLVKWVNRISYVCLKEIKSNSNKIQKGLTIDQNSKFNIRENRFKSLEIKKHENNNRQRTEQQIKTSVQTKKPNRYKIGLD